jgi:aerobic-type carbon monoxide dehydrogenase small subunit (CoxS/CutS family)
VGQAFSGDLALLAGRIASEEITPIDDVRSTADYRRKTAVALTHDALQLAWKRTRGEAALPPLGLDRETAPNKEPLLSEEEVGESEGVFYVESEERVGIELTVNGVGYALDVAPSDLLLNVLRERLELTGAKYGCGIGECGACTVWIDGEAVLGCLILAVTAHSKEIRTIEGEAENGQLSDLQEAFVEENAFQCGYCTPGMLMMTKKLLEEIPTPSDEEIVDYLKGNHCRCTGYASIVRAVRKAAGGESA